MLSFFFLVKIAQISVKLSLKNIQSRFMSYSIVRMDFHSHHVQGIVIDVGYENLNWIIEQVSNKMCDVGKCTNHKYSNSFVVSGKSKQFIYIAILLAIH